MAISLECNCGCYKCSCNDLLQGLIIDSNNNIDKKKSNTSSSCCNDEIENCKCSNATISDGVELKECCPISKLNESTFFRFFIPQLKGNELLVDKIKETIRNELSNSDSSAAASSSAGNAADASTSTSSSDILFIDVDYKNQIVQIECSVDYYLFKLLNIFKSLNLQVAAIQSKDCPELLESIEDTPLLNNESIYQSSPLSNQFEEKERVFEIKGMKCQVGCANRIEVTLLSNSDIKSAKINFKSKTLHLIGNVSDRLVRKSIEKLGFRCKRLKLSLPTSPLLLNNNQHENNIINSDNNSSEEELDPISEQITTTIIDMDNNETTNSTNGGNGEIEMDNFNIKIEDPSLLKNEIESISIGVFGMTCASCVGMVEHSIKSVDGVLECNVNLLAERAEVKYYSKTVTNLNEIIDSIEMLGFDAKLIQQSKPGTFYLRQLESSTASSSSIKFSNETIDSLLNKFKNSITNISIVEYNQDEHDHDNSELIILKVEGDSLLVGPRLVINYLKNEIGMEFELYNPELSDVKDSLLRKREILKWKRLFLFSIAWTGPLIVIAMILVPIKSISFLHKDIFSGFPVEALIGFVLATPVQFVSGWSFYKAAWAALKNFHGNMDLLVAVGSTAAYVYSVISIILGMVNPMYEAMHFFETSASLITFIILGRWLENIAKGHTSSAIVKLMNLQAKETTLITFSSEGNGTSVIESEEVISSNLIAFGDYLKVVPGQSIPTDGVVINGGSSIDESMLTGESIPVSKKVGDNVTGGTLNLDGVLIIQANKVGSESTLSQIIGLVQQAQTSKAPIQALADTISKYFVPIILILGCITFAIWIAVTETGSVSAEWRHNTSPFLYSFLTAISVVVIACPCALGLATPTAVMVGTGVGAAMGILIKGGKPLETAHKATAILFDKTGTITTGKMTVTDYRLISSNANDNHNDANNNIVATNGGSSEDDKLFFKIVGASESNSEHPIGKAIVTFCKQTLSVKGADIVNSPVVQEYQFPPVEDFKGIPGRGLSCIIDSNIQVFIGNLSFMKDNSINVPSEYVEVAQSWETNGKTVIYVSFGTENSIQFKGIMSISDIPRDDSRHAIKKLTSMGLKCYMVTGDNRRAAGFIANQVGISQDNIFSEVVPKEKAEKVLELQQQGNIVCFVGDGVNDSPALSQADVGISVATGTDIAIESSSIVLLKNSLTDVYRSIHLSRVVFRRIRINFTLALIYNLCAVPLAAGLFRVIFGVELPPMAAAAAMVVSSLSVLSSSLLLKLYSPPK